jgi:DNA-directed RNA polymerase subunit L
MSMWTAIMVLGIVAMTQIARVLRAKYQAEHGIVEDRKGRVQVLDKPADTELQREVETLRERIKVLERIATDANSAEARETRAIAAEIESLRDR